MIAFLLGGAFVPGVAFKVAFGWWQFGDVIPCRAGLSPVSTLARVDEHKGLQEYARLKVFPRAASRSIFDVL